MKEDREREKYLLTSSRFIFFALHFLSISSCAFSTILRSFTFVPYFIISVLCTPFVCSPVPVLLFTAYICYPFFMVCYLSFYVFHSLHLYLSSSVSILCRHTLSVHKVPAWKLGHYILHSVCCTLLARVTEDASQ